MASLIQQQKVNTDPTFIIQINSSWIKDTHMKGKGIKFL